MAASRFEEMLASGKTRVLEPVGRDLSSLGQPDTPERPASTPRRRSSPFSRPRRKRNASAQSDETTLGDEAIVSAPTLYATTAYDSPTPAGGRTATTTAPAGHSSSPDLAALVAKQKRRSTVPDEALPSRRGSLPPSESMHSTMAAAGSIRALSPSLSDPGGLSDSGSLSPPSLAVGRARQLSATPSLGQVSARSDEQSPPQPPHSRAGSFVVVSPEQPTDPRASKRKSSGPTGGLRIDMGTGAVGSQGIGSSRVSLEQPSAVPSSLWGNSVRKTSGLLKRTFGSKVRSEGPRRSSDTYTAITRQCDIGAVDAALRPFELAEFAAAARAGAAELRQTDATAASRGDRTLDFADSAGRNVESRWVVRIAAAVFDGDARSLDIGHCQSAHAGRAVDARAQAVHVGVVGA